jgi:hypothetical protein
MRSNASNARRRGHGDRDIAAVHDIELHSGISSNAREAPTMRGCGGNSAARSCAVGGWTCLSRSGGGGAVHGWERETGALIMGRSSEGASSERGAAQAGAPCLSARKSGRRPWEVELAPMEGRTGSSRGAAGEEGPCCSRSPKEEQGARRPPWLGCGAEGGVGVPTAVEKLEGAPGFIHGRAALLGKEAWEGGRHGCWFPWEGECW